MSFDPNWLLVVIGAVMILLELSLGGFAGFDFVLVGSTFVVGGLVGRLTGSTVVGYLTASVLGLAYIAVGRRVVRSRMSVPKQTRSNVDALHGRQAIVQKRIAAHDAGLVKVGDEVWRALPVNGSGPFEVGALVTVEGVDGVTLQVR